MIRARLAGFVFALSCAIGMATPLDSVVAQTKRGGNLIAGQTAHPLPFFLEKPQEPPPDVTRRAGDQDEPGHSGLASQVLWRRSASPRPKTLRTLSLSLTIPSGILCLATPRAMPVIPRGTCPGSV